MFPSVSCASAGADSSGLAVSPGSVAADLSRPQPLGKLIRIPTSARIAKRERTVTSLSVHLFGGKMHARHRSRIRTAPATQNESARTPRAEEPPSAVRDTAPVGDEFAVCLVQTPS